MSQNFTKPVAQGCRRLFTAALWMAASAPAIAVEATRPDPKLINLEIPRVASDKSVRFDYDLVYVRAPRKASAVWANTEPPTVNPADAELMLLHADGSEEVLVPVEKGESIADPYVSFDGKSVYFAKYHAPSSKGAPGGSDIFKVDVATRQLVRLTHQEQTPNLGAVDPKRDQLAGVVFNLAPCPLPDGKLAFVSDRNCYRGVKDLDAALQLFTMDAGGANVEQIGHLNLGGAMHPVVLKDGRIMFSSSEGQGIRIGEQWGLWTIRPDGTHWEPLFSPFVGGSSSLHFQTQLTSGDVVVEFYYPGATTQGFGTLFRFPTDVPPGTAQFGPGWIDDPRNMIRARTNEVRMRYQKFPFSPRGARIVTEFATNDDVPPNNSRQDIGKVSHPSAAPDNHLLAVWTPPSTTRAAGDSKDFDSGIYLIKGGEPVNHPTEMLLVKNDPDYYEMWPRALTPYKRIYGIDEPARLAPVANDGQQSPHLAEGSPFGLVGTSSLYKRESYPDGVVPSGGVTATSRHGDNLLKMFMELGSVYRAEGTNNWTIQGADAGRYANEDIWGIRIVALEPVTHAWKEPRQFGHSSGGNGVGPHAAERLRILGEFPVRKFDAAGKQPLDADGNPDTSFLVKLPADVAWTFQTLDRRGMVLNMAQTWHQLRPGEIRHDCGGCHAHSQEPTRFERTAAAQPGYKPFDLTKDIPLFTTRKHDVSGRQWDTDHKTGMRSTKTSVANVEYFRDVKPIFERSCVACHTNRNGDAAAGLVLDDEQPLKIEGLQAKVPGTYVRLAADNEAHFGPKPIGGQWHYRMQESRYLRKMQARRSLLIWKVFDERLDGFQNDDFPTEIVAGDPKTLRWHGERLEPTTKNLQMSDLDYIGGSMPPPAAIAGTYLGPDKQPIKVPPLSDEEKLTLARWIDLGCPIDLDHNPAEPDRQGYGWMCDDGRPTVTVTYPRSGKNDSLDRILVGMHDYYSGLDPDSFRVVADFELSGVAPGENLAGNFRPLSDGVWQWKLDRPVNKLATGVLKFSIKDRQGNSTQVGRAFSVGK